MARYARLHRETGAVVDLHEVEDLDSLREIFGDHIFIEAHDGVHRGWIYDEVSGRFIDPNAVIIDETPPVELPIETLRANALATIASWHKFKLQDWTDRYPDFHLWPIDDAIYLLTESEPVQETLYQGLLNRWRGENDSSSLESVELATLRRYAAEILEKKNSYQLYLGRLENFRKEIEAETSEQERDWLEQINFDLLDNLSGQL